MNRNISLATYHQRHAQNGLWWRTQKTHVVHLFLPVRLSSFPFVIIICVHHLLFIIVVHHLCSSILLHHLFASISAHLYSSIFIVVFLRSVHGQLVPLLFGFNFFRQNKQKACGPRTPGCSP